MKRAWRFVKWLVKGIGWFEAYMFIVCFSLGGGVVATLQGNKELRDMFFMITLAAVAAFFLAVIYWGAVNTWKRFIKDDEQVFAILKQEKIDGQ